MVASSNIHQCGEMVFFKFFEKYPSYIIQFPKFKDSSLVQLKNSPAFRNHGYLIMCQIGDSVKHLGTPEGWEHVRESWHAHGNMHIPLRVKKVQFMQFRDVVVDQILAISSMSHVDEVKKAWMVFFNAIFGFSFEKSGAQ
ncbi:globin CTT-VI-like [Culicoides brevitarsis]|uniref:globin CTT-VI-like n=1 Tax=Culicoides brevitarsis TaxID=469753 RepID=UPI00307BDF0D